MRHFKDIQSKPAVVRNFGRRIIRHDENIVPTPAPNSDHLISQGNQRIGPELALNILHSANFDGQRSIYNHHVKLLGDIMLSGEWIDGDQITLCRTPDGKMFLVNGYHRLHAVFEFDAPQIFNIRIVDVESVEDVRKIYVSFDGASTRKRSEGEILDAMKIVSEYGITKQVASSVFKAAPLLLSNMQYRNYQNAPEYVSNILKRLEKSEEFWKYGKKYQDMITGAKGKHRRKFFLQGVTAVALATIRHRPRVAGEFWPAVATMNNLDANDPRMALARALDDKSYPAQGKDGEIPHSVIDCSLAWNAFYEGRTLSVIRTTSVKNFRLAGTLWG